MDERLAKNRAAGAVKRRGRHFFVSDGARYESGPPRCVPNWAAAYDTSFSPIAQSESALVARLLVKLFVDDAFDVRRLEDVVDILHPFRLFLNDPRY